MRSAYLTIRDLVSDAVLLSSLRHDGDLVGVKTTRCVLALVVINFLMSSLVEVVTPPGLTQMGFIALFIQINVVGLLLLLGRYKLVAAESLVTITFKFFTLIYIIHGAHFSGIRWIGTWESMAFLYTLRLFLYAI